LEDLEVNEEEDGADENGEVKDEAEGADEVKEEVVEEDESEDVIKKYGLDTYDDEGQFVFRGSKAFQFPNSVQ
jgi:hypothetical protein